MIESSMTEVTDQCKKRGSSARLHKNSSVAFVTLCLCLVLTTAKGQGTLDDLRDIADELADKDRTSQVWVDDDGCEVYTNKLEDEVLNRMVRVGPTKGHACTVPTGRVMFVNGTEVPDGLPCEEKEMCAYKLDCDYRDYEELCGLTEIEQLQDYSRNCLAQGILTYRPEGDISEIICQPGGNDGESETPVPTVASGGEGPTSAPIDAGTKQPTSLILEPKPSPAPTSLILEPEPSPAPTQLTSDEPTQTANKLSSCSDGSAARQEAGCVEEEDEEDSAQLPGAVCKLLLLLQVFLGLQLLI